MKYFLIIIVISILFIACSEEKLKPQIDSTIRSEELPDQESNNATITFTEEGVLKAILYADNIKVLVDQNKKLLKNVRIEFFNELEERTSVLTSLYGRIDDDTQDMYAIDSVVAVSDSGTTLLTDELVWKNETKKIKSQKFVRIESPDEILEGYGFESDQDLNNYTIFDITYITTIKEDK
ncbi:MAG: LPS export ABC transporter periplasmic protein LptC [Melioribacteraceae bacterium]|nr:LPS export ABC transporter periplasmic protein LptC [Melioribacteraceae bacterium]